MIEDSQIHPETSHEMELDELLYSSIVSLQSNSVNTRARVTGNSADHEFKCQSFQTSFLLLSHHSRPSQGKDSAARPRGGCGKTCAHSIIPTGMMNRLYRSLSLSLLPPSPSETYIYNSFTLHPKGESKLLLSPKKKKRIRRGGTFKRAEE